MSQQAVKVGRNKGRKPAHMNGANLSGQDAIWVGIRTLKNFTREELVMWLFKNGYPNINGSTVNSYMRRLSKGKFLGIAETGEKGNQKNQQYRYELINDCGHTAPKLSADGSPSRRGMGSRNLWLSMRMLGEFDYLDLVVTSSNDDVQVSSATAERYINALKTAGYLIQVKAAEIGKSPRRFRLLPTKNTGPKPPVVQAVKQIYDPNINEIVWSSEDQKEVC
ncbi:MAG: hypothetical protein JKY50_09385 [Oleispira sp.]|nr:hypothetical protein [Oleispira sp.]